jgi:pimeloyl-ACP methyl ester carboxylesterase
MASIAKSEFAAEAGSKVEYFTAGEGSPAIVFLNGHGQSFSTSWASLFPEVIAISKVVAHNRPKFRQPAMASISALRELLDHLKIAPPYLLVAHSMGGLHANLFARLYPKDVCGVVFIESSHPRQEERFGPFLSPLMRLALRMGKAGIASRVSIEPDPIPCGPWRKQLTALGYSLRSQLSF